MSKLRTILVVVAALVMLVSLPGDRSFAKKAGGGGVTVNINGVNSGTVNGSTVNVSVSGGGGGGGGGGNPSWSQTINTSSRFTAVLGGDGQVDNETGLVWETAPFGSGVWTDALGVCNALAVGNRLGWHLPTVQELATLLDQDAFIGGSPLALPAGHPFQGIATDDVYWTSTGVFSDSTVAWTVNFGVPLVDVADNGESHLAWCVRTGSGLAFQ
jgi:hypothetical protein